MIELLQVIELRRASISFINYIYYCYLYVLDMGRNIRKFNATMALRWLIFLPFIFAVCVVLGVLQGIGSILKRMCSIMLQDMGV